MTFLPDSGTSNWENTNVNSFVEIDVTHKYKQTVLRYFVVKDSVGVRMRSTLL